MSVTSSGTTTAGGALTPPTLSEEIQSYDEFGNPSTRYRIMVDPGFVVVPSIAGYNAQMDDLEARADALASTQHEVASAQKKNAKLRAALDLLRQTCASQDKKLKYTEQAILEQMLVADEKEKVALEKEKKACESELRVIVGVLKVTIVVVVVLLDSASR